MMIGSTPDKPLRCSKLAWLSKCTMRMYLVSELQYEDDEGGIAAQTGSLTHEGVAAFHKTQDHVIEERKRAAWDAINAARSKFPLAEENEVRLFITPYMDDPRNIHANCIAVEEEIHFTLPAHEIDDSGLPIYLKGTLDQLRLISGQAYVYDLKTGKPTGWAMIHDAAIQMAAYVYGVREIGLGTRLDTHLVREGSKYTPKTDPIWANARPGKIIRNHGYRVREKVGSSPDGVFWEMPYTIEDVNDIMDGVRLAVALFRNGHVTYGPGAWCSYCEFKGMTECTHAYHQLQVRGK